MWWRRLCLVVALLAVPAGAVVAQRERRPPSPVTPRELILAANAHRTRGFADPRGADPGSWSDPSCPCHAADGAALDALVLAGRSLAGPGPQITQVVVLAALPEQIVLEVVDRIPPYAEVDRDGRVVRRWPGRGERRWRVVLVRGKITNWRAA